MVSRETAIIDLARSGAEYALDQFRTDFCVEEKSSRTDLVTNADLETQRQIVAEIEESFPSDAIVGEEDDKLKTIPEEKYAWVIDPIDGTHNFAHGMNEWVTSVALVEDSETVSTANVAPALGEEYMSTTNKVARNGRQVSVSDKRDPDIFRVASTLRPKTHGRCAERGMTNEIISRFGELRVLGTAQLTLSSVASGMLDAAIGINPAPSDWDTVAGVHQIRSAGGTVTDIRGNEWTPGGPGLVASNGRIHEELVAVAEAYFD